jgi:predicted transcriptional regulator
VSKPGTFKDILSNLSVKDEVELNAALKGLIEKGLLTEEIIDGEPCYELTSLGKSVVVHSFSAESDRN